MARGLLGPDHPGQLLHRRREALGEADLVILAGAPCDFRLGYGRHIGRRAALVAVNLDRADLRRNRRPTVAVQAPPGRFLCRLASARVDPSRWDAWYETLRARDGERSAEIREMADRPARGGINPLTVARALDEAVPDDATVVADGGDFVATCSYVFRPRGPLSWLDPGVFGTLGVGAGFALGAALVCPERPVWALFGDGAFGFGLAELDSFVRHGVGVVAVIGNDAGWAQIARDQVELLGDDVATVLRRTAYHEAAAGLGALGLEAAEPEQLPGVLRRARAEASTGRPVVVNVHLGSSDFRKGSISM
jgi:acetolactate synthase-1/2/3 large subunit